MSGTERHAVLVKLSTRDRLERVIKTDESTDRREREREVRDREGLDVSMCERSS